MPYKGHLIIWVLPLVFLTLLAVSSSISTKGGGIALAAPIKPNFDVVKSMLPRTGQAKEVNDAPNAIKKRVVDDKEEEEETTSIPGKEHTEANTVKAKAEPVVELASDAQDKFDTVNKFDSIGDDGKGTIGCYRKGIHRTCLPPVTHKTNPCGTTYYLRTCKKKPTKGKGKKHGKDDTGPPAAAEAGTLAQVARALPGLDIAKDE